ncbi:hypothetical protein SAMN04488518_101735 [Pseudovibrio ascidiaceicola]|uniref:Uncharacterized protein n=1 Tax=Pseudovibrio ascidiaceicola TaxID=285279 RepID=A0A1I3W2G4_9HYPH|nr:hypothetical protein [Pseudovibrio ascidiaceicola]SFK00827.1 hypothetical protein SAMN04488518_101735 [Pseudovibrio ascidiaceicola]
MTSVSLSNFQNIATDTASSQKLTVEGGDVQPRLASTSVKGRFVSWLALQGNLDSQKAADQGAFRTALQDKYGATLGTQAYEKACNACGFSAGQNHSLTSRQVVTGVHYADEKLNSDPLAALISEHEVTAAKYATSSSNDTVLDEDTAAFVSKVDAKAAEPENHDIASVLPANLLEGDFSVPDNEVRQAAVDTLDVITQFISEKYTPEIAEAVEGRIVEAEVFDKLLAEQLDPNNSVELRETISLFIDEIWLEAKRAHIETLL